MPKPRLKIPNLRYTFEENARYQYIDPESEQTIKGQYEYYNAENNRELQGAIGRTRSRIKKAVGKIAKGEYRLPSSTMDALYRLDAQLGKLNHELILGNDENVEKESVPQWMLQKDFPELAGRDIKIKSEEQFEFMDGIEDYQKQMDTLAKMGEILNEHVTDKASYEGSTILAFLCDDDVEKAKKDIPVDQISSLRARTDAFLSDPAFHKAMKDPQVLAALQSGHGGKMEELLGAKMAEKKAAPITGDLAPADPYSFGGRLWTLRQDAKEFVSEVGSAQMLENMGAERKQSYINKAKDMIAGYIAFDHKCRDPKDKTKLDPNRTKAFAGSIAEMNRLISTVVKDEDFEERLDDLSAKQIFNVMKEMGEKPQKEFMEIMVDNDLVPKAMYTNAPEIKNAPKAENAAEKPQVTGKTEPTVKLPGF